MKRKMIRAAVGMGVALGFALGGCGGRVSQVNVGVEQTPGDMAGNQGTSGEGQVGQEPAAIPECPLTRRTDPRLLNGIGSASSDGSLLAVIGNDDAPLQVFRVADNTVMSAFDIPPSHTYSRATISPDNSRVAAAGQRDDGAGVVAIYRIADGALLADLPVTQPATGADLVAPEFSHDGRLLVTVNGGNFVIEIWSVPDFQLVRASSLYDAPEELVGDFSAVHFSPDDKRLVTAQVGALRVRNVADGSLVWSQPLSSKASGADAMFSPKGTRVITGGLYGTANYSVSVVTHDATRIWNAGTGELIQELSPVPAVGTRSLSFYDEDHVLIGDDPRGARIWARGGTGLFAPSCFLTSEREPPIGPSSADGPARVTASVGGKLIYVFGMGSWIYEQTP